MLFMMVLLLSRSFPQGEINKSSEDSLKIISVKSIKIDTFILDLKTKYACRKELDSIQVKSRATQTILKEIIKGLEINDRRTDI